VFVGFNKFIEEFDAFEAGHNGNGTVVVSGDIGCTSFDEVFDWDRVEA
jgi:hypothetical protein